MVVASLLRVPMVVRVTRMTLPPVRLVPLLLPGVCSASIALSPWLGVGSLPFMPMAPGSCSCSQVPVPVPVRTPAAEWLNARCLLHTFLLLLLDIVLRF